MDSISPEDLLYLPRDGGAPGAQLYLHRLLALLTNRESEDLCLIPNPDNGAGRPSLRPGITSQGRLEKLFGSVGHGSLKLELCHDWLISWFLDAATRELAKARRHGKQLSVLCIDLDDLGQLNLRYGRPAGNRVVSAAATVISRSCRAEDVLWHQGEDEFAVILADTGADSAEAVARRLVAGISHAARQAGVGATTSASIGISTYPLHGDDLPVLMASARVALHLAKARGKGNVQLAERAVNGGQAEREPGGSPIESQPSGGQKRREPGGVRDESRASDSPVEREPGGNRAASGGPAEPGSGGNGFVYSSRAHGDEQPGHHEAGSEQASCDMLARQREAGMEQAPCDEQPGHHEAGITAERRSQYAADEMGTGSKGRSGYGSNANTIPTNGTAGSRAADILPTSRSEADILVDELGRHGCSVVVASMSPLLLAGMRHTLDGLSDVQVVAEVAEPVGLPLVIDDLRPDLVFADFRMIAADDFALVRLIESQNLPIKLAISAAEVDQELIRLAAESWIDGVILQSSSQEEIVSGLEKIYRGQKILPEEIVSALNEIESKRKVIKELSEREIDVLCLVAEGKSNSQIASELFVTVNTVRFHLANIYQKLGVSNRTEAANYYHRQDLGCDGQARLL